METEKPRASKICIQMVDETKIMEKHVPMKLYRYGVDLSSYGFLRGI